MSVAWAFFNYPGAKRRKNNVTTEIENDTCLTIKHFKKNILMGYYTKSDKKIGDENESVSISVQSIPHIVMVGNISIYNTKNKNPQNIKGFKTNNASESILRVYGLHGFQGIFKRIRGEYAFWIVDFLKMKVYIGRDPFGLRPLYRMYSRQHHCLLLSTDMRVIMKPAEKLKKIQLLEQFPPGAWEEYTIRKNGSIFLSDKGKHFSLNTHFIRDTQIYVYTKLANGTALNIKNAFEKQIEGGRLKGIYITGEISSVWLINIISHFTKNSKENIHTFSVGLKGSPSLKLAADLANHFQTVHHEIVLSEEDIKKYIFNVVYQFKTFDPHTIRNGIGNYFLSKVIAENYKDLVIFTSHGAKELFQGYPHFLKAPDSLAAGEECNRLLQNFHCYDGLVLSNMMTEFGVEVRCPFLDSALVRFILSRNIMIRRFFYTEFGDILRIGINGFKYENPLLIQNMRHEDDLGKNVERIISKFADELICDSEFIEESEKIIHCKPMTKEAYLYRKIFDTHYKNLQFNTPSYWSPRWIPIKQEKLLTKKTIIQI